LNDPRPGGHTTPRGEGVSASIMKEYIGSGHLRGVLVGRSMVVSHLLFVDDVLFFFGKEEDLKRTLNSLELICVATCMEKKIQKLVIFALNVERGLLHKLETFCTFGLNNINYGPRYLGYTLKPNFYMK
jgi:hypothetical protein